jgi:hypothetical protein
VKAVQAPAPGVFWNVMSQDLRRADEAPRAGMRHDLPERSIEPFRVAAPVSSQNRARSRNMSGLP